jgi:hypothetical protein
LKELEESLAADYKKLEEDLNNTKFEAEFDPSSKADLEFVSKEIEKILESAPEIKKIEEKVQLIKGTHESLDKLFE